MTNSRSRASTNSRALAALAGVALWAGLAASAVAGPRKRVVVLDFDGPKAEKFHDDLVKLVKKSYTVVPTDKWNGTAEQMAATGGSDANIKKIAKKLKVDAVITGKIEKRRDEYLVHLKLRNGATGGVANSADTKSAGPRLDGKASGDVKDELLDAIDQLSGGGDDDDASADDADAKPAKKKPAGKKVAAADDGDDDADAKPAKKKPAGKKVAAADDASDDDADAKPKKGGFGKKKPAADDASDDDADAKPKKSGFGKKKPAGKKAADDDDDADAKPVAKPEPKPEPKVAKKPAKKKPAADDDDAKAAPDASHDDDDSPLKAGKKPAKVAKKVDPPSDDGDDAAKGASDDDGVKPRKKVAAKGGDDDEGGGVEKSSDDGGEAADPETALSPGQRAIDATIGLSVIARKLSFSYSSSLVNTPPGYRGVPVAGLLLDGVIYPGAIGHTRSGLLANVGLAVTFDRVLHISSQARYTDATGAMAVATLGTTQQRWAVGPAIRHAFGEGAQAPVVGGQLRIGKQDFNVGALPTGAAADIPNVSYTTIEPSLTAIYPVSPKIALHADVGALIITSAGPIATAAQYGQASVFGFDLDAGGDYQLTKTLFLRAALRFETIGFTFTGAGMMTSNRDGGTTQNVFGARDSYYGGLLTLGYLY